MHIKIASYWQIPLEIFNFTANKAIVLRPWYWSSLKKKLQLEIQSKNPINFPMNLYKESEEREQYI